jgi:hypothetical protein
MNDDKEIELFKKMIDLRQVAEDFGFLLDEKNRVQIRIFTCVTDKK